MRVVLLAAFGVFTCYGGLIYTPLDGEVWTAESSLVRVISPDELIAGLGAIEFSETPLKTKNPVFSPQTYGGSSFGGVTVSTGGFFSGMRIATDAEQFKLCPTGRGPSCVAGSPSSPLQMDPSSQSWTTVDKAMYNTTSLSGFPQFRGPVSIQFSFNVSAFVLNLGFLDSTHSVVVWAFDSNGRILGKANNDDGDFTTVGLATINDTPLIAGITISTVTVEYAGFGVDRLAIGISRNIATRSPMTASIPDATVPCKQQPATDITGVPSVTPGFCPFAVFTPTFVDTPLSPGCTGEPVIQRTWTIRNVCQQVVQLNQIIKFEDRTRPQFPSFARKISVKCGVPLLSIPVTDSCDANPISRPRPIVFPCEGKGNRLRVAVHEATDGCGNRQLASQLVAVLDQ